MAKSKLRKSGTGTLLKENLGEVLIIERFYKDKTVLLLVDVDDVILCDPSSNDIDDIIKSLKDAFNITNEGKIDDYLGAKITQPTEDTIKLRRLHLIQHILDEEGMLPSSKTKDKAAPLSTIL